MQQLRQGNIRHLLDRRVAVPNERLGCTSPKAWNSHEIPYSRLFLFVHMDQPMVLVGSNVENQGPPRAAPVLKC